MRLRAFVHSIAFDVFCVALVVGAAIFMLLQTGCQWARVRYADKAAQDAELLVCRVEVNSFVCREYHAANRQDGVQVVPANSAERVDM